MVIHYVAISFVPKTIIFVRALVSRCDLLGRSRFAFGKTPREGLAALCARQARQRLASARGSKFGWSPRSQLCSACARTTQVLTHAVRAAFFRLGTHGGRARLPNVVRPFSCREVVTMRAWPVDGRCTSTILRILGREKKANSSATFRAGRPL